MAEQLRILDMRGKKKKGYWEKAEYDNWLPRAVQGANRHCNQLGYSLSAMLRMKQRKVYPTEEHLRRAIVSMLPKRFRNMKMELVEDNMVYGENNSYMARMQYPDGGWDSVSVVKKPNGYALKFGEETIRSIAKDILGNEPIDYPPRSISTVEQMVLMANNPVHADIIRAHEAGHNEFMEKFLKSKGPIYVERVVSVAKGCEELVDQLKEQRHERTERMIQRTELSKAWLPNKDFDVGELQGLNDE